MSILPEKLMRSRIAEAREQLRSCVICPRKCRVDRTRGETGFCGLTDQAHCFREILNYNEEQELVPSYLVHFTGCNLRCEFCMVAEWNEEPQANPVMDLDLLSERIEQRRREGAKTLSLLGGEPSVNILGILQLLDSLKSQITTVWNSNMYFNRVVADLLDGLVDVYLADFKCGNPVCAKTILKADDYVEVVEHNITHVQSTTEVIIRHVMLPGHFECCTKPILLWVAQTVPHVKVSVKGGYIPPVNPCHAPVEYIREEELESADRLGKELDLRLIA